jgi:hypothetical protein
MRIRPIVLVLIAATAARPLAAQSRTASDVTGGTVTSAALVGGNFVPRTGLRPVPVAANQYDPNAIERIRALATALDNQVARGQLTGPNGEAIDPAIQLEVLGVLKSATAGAGLSVQAVEDILAVGVPGRRSLATALVEALVAMGPTPTPVPVAAAARALNAYVAGADPAFLAAPPGEFVAAFAIVQRYSIAATQALPTGTTPAAPAAKP